MRPQDIVPGASYRFHSHPHYSWFKAVRVLKANEATNHHSYAVVEGHQTVDRNDSWGMTKYIRPCDLDKPKDTK